MSLPYADPSLPSGVAPIFADIDAARGDHLRANNSLIWSNLTYLDLKTGSLVSPVAGYDLQLYQADSAASLLKFSNVTTGLTAARGFDIGLDASEQGRIWNYENTDLIIGTNNTEMLLIDNAGNIGIRNGIPLYIYSAGNDKYLSLIHNDTDALISTNSGNIYTNKFFGIGVTPSNPLHVMSTTTPQVRIGYDAGSYATIGMADGGALSIVCGEATGAITLSPGSTGSTVFIGISSATAKLALIDSSGGKYGYFQHDGTNLLINTFGTGSGDVRIVNTTEATSSTAAALISSGGLAVAKKAYIGTDLNVGGTVILATGAITGNVVPTGYLKSGLGRWPTGYAEGVAQPQSVVWAALISFLPNTNDEILLHGGIDSGSGVIVLAKAVKTSSTVITLYGALIDTWVHLTIQNTASSSLDYSIAW